MSKTKNYISCASRGRGKTDENGKNSQHLEINSGEYSNAITSVQKDYLVIEYEEDRREGSRP
jgi:hypothetical protein